MSLCCLSQVSEYLSRNCVHGNYTASELLYMYCIRAEFTNTHVLVESEMLKYSWFHVAVQKLYYMYM